MKRSHFLAHWTSDFFCRTNWWYRSWQDHPPRLPEAKAQVKDPLPPPTTSFSVHIVYIYVCDVSFLLFSPPQALQFLDLLNFISHTTPKSDDSWYCEYYTTTMATFSTILLLYFDRFRIMNYVTIRHLIWYYLLLPINYLSFTYLLPIYYLSTT